MRQQLRYSRILIILAGLACFVAAPGPAHAVPVLTKVTGTVRDVCVATGGTNCAQFGNPDSLILDGTDTPNPDFTSNLSTIDFLGAVQANFDTTADPTFTQVELRVFPPGLPGFPPPGSPIDWRFSFDDAGPGGSAAHDIVGLTLVSNLGFDAYALAVTFDSISITTSFSSLPNPPGAATISFLIETRPSAPPTPTPLPGPLAMLLAGGLAMVLRRRG
jgi:hypothetical protein